MRNIFELKARRGDDKWQSNPAFDRRHLRSIELALRKAWDELQQDREAAQELSTQREERISHLLRERLNNIRERETGGVDGYDCDTFERPHIGAEMTSPQGQIRKPDIVLGLSGRPRSGVTDSMTDSIFVECKILAHGRQNVGLYCREGLSRFVTGAYSAWMREAMMVAYVRTTQTLPEALEAVTSTKAAQEALATNGEVKRCNLSRIEPRVYITVHERDWPYANDQGMPGPIEVRHLWLRV